ncbi:hypothetical protein EDC04DRAFT_642185 [Pisolithus marmoratus]|nr:hypothetical protein EDC04DRAFT_642185 [Pisolithus marmoratus]
MRTAELVIELSTSISAATWSHNKVVEPPAGVPWPGCLLSESPNNRLMLPGWIVAILVATTLFGLTLHLLFSSMRWRLKSFRDLTISNIKEEIRSIQPTTQMLIRDSVLFYIPILAMLVASVVVVSTVHNSLLVNITCPIVLALYSFCSARFIIHTRETIGQPACLQPVEELSLSILSRHR